MKYIACFLILLLIFASSAEAKTVSDFIAEGYTLKDMEKGFVWVSRAYLNVQVPEGHNYAQWCNPPGNNCRQMKWIDYCSGAIVENVGAGMMVITLDRCGYPDGQNRNYPPTEAEINMFLTTFTGVDEILPKNPGLAKREEYLDE